MNALQPAGLAADKLAELSRLRIENGILVKENRRLVSVQKSVIEAVKRLEGL